MLKKGKGRRSSVVVFVASVGLPACNALIGLNNFSEQSAGSDAGGAITSIDAPCESNRQCTSIATAQLAPGGSDAGPTDAQGNVPAICVRATARCAPLLSPDCPIVTGDYLDNEAIVIGSLFAVTGATASQNIPRQQSATLAIEEINLAGGVPSATAGNTRPLVMVSCDTAGSLSRAATHLVTDLNVPAIVGPNTSQDTLDVSNNVTIRAGVVVMSPTAVAASIADLIDNDLTWLMIPTDNQRGQLMIQQINALESTLKAARAEAASKLAIVYRNDALGLGTRTSLNSLTFNGQSLAAPINAGSPTGNVQIDGYDPKQPNYAALVAKEVAFLPDIIVLAGTAETVTSIMTPIEQQWPAGVPRPYYFMIDPSKGPELLSAVTGNDDLRQRVRGTGTTPDPGSIPVLNAFDIDYLARYGVSATASGMGPTYDATYAIAYALAATKDLPVTGANIAKGLRELAGGSLPIDTGSPDLLGAFQALASGGKIAARGTFCPLDWQPNGTVKGGIIEMWCIGLAGSTPVFQSSGLYFDISNQSFLGVYTQCE